MTKDYPKRPLARDPMFIQQVGDIERRLYARPAYDFVAEGYGRHGMELIFTVKRAGVTIAWTIMTDWLLQESVTKLKTAGHNTPFGYFDGLGFIDYHSTRRVQEWNSELDHCEFTGGKCFCGGTALGGMELFREFVKSGESVVWLKLEEWLVSVEKDLESTR